MAHFTSRTLLALVPSLAAAGFIVGCSGTVEGGGDEGKGGSESAEQTTSTSTGSGGSAGSGKEMEGWCPVYEGDGCKPGEEQECTTYMWTPDDACSPTTETSTCALVPGKACTTAWSIDPSECAQGCDTPLVLSFDGAPVSFVADAEHAFDLNGTRSQATDWPSARTPWLALDRDGSGRLEDGAELFGSMTPLASGRRARNGFEALRELDTNGDGTIDAADARFGELLVWADADGDRASSASELRTAARAEILSIDLAYRDEPRCDARGNCEVERAAFTWRDASGAVRTGAVVDVHLRAQR